MFAILMLVCGADPTFTVENKLCQSFVVENRMATEAEAAPTPLGEVVRVLGLLPTPQVGFVDFGCGADARWCIAAAEQWPRLHNIIGVEIDPARAAAARERVRLAGFVERIQIITGDAITTDVRADVGVAYLYSDVLEKLKPRLEKLRAFASYLHRPPGLPAVKNGDTWIYTQPAAQQAAASTPAALWNGQLYSHPQCNDPRCAMCNAIRSQLAATASQRQPAKTSSGRWVRMCDGRRCWMQWVAE